MSHRLIAQIESQLDELLQRHQRLKVEHDQLRQREQLWMHEREQLQAKHEAARQRVESLITRLKQIEENVQ